MAQQPPSSFARRSLLGGAAALVGGSVLGATHAGTAAAHKPSPVTRPRKLAEGDVVMVVSPGGATNATAVNKGVALLESWGLEVRLSKHALDKFGYLSAPDADRLADLNEALADPDVRAVMSTRGGYGTQRIIDEVEFPASDPKLIIGYSDITALHLAVYNRAATASLHSPMAAWSSNNTEETAKALRGALTTTEPVVLTRDASEPTAAVEVAGTASGTLLGGNLSMLVSEPESRNGIDLDDAILFIEDVGESPYRVDRMLTELLRAGTLNNVAGVAIGQFTDSTGNPGDWTIAETLRDRLTPLGVPVIGGLRVGHGADPRVMPLGVPAELDTKAGTLTVEAAVSD